MFIKRRAPLVGRCVYVTTSHGCGNLDCTAAATDDVFSTEMDSLAAPIHGPHIAVWQLLTTHEGVLRRVLERRLRTVPHTMRKWPFRVAWLRANRVITDAMIAAADGPCDEHSRDAPPPPVGMALPERERYYIGRADLAAMEQSVDGDEDIWWPIVKALPAVPSDERCAAGGLTLTVAECNALVVDSLCWRARTWIRAQPPAAGTSRQHYYERYSEANARCLNRYRFELVVEEHYMKLQVNLDSSWVRR